MTTRHPEGFEAHNLKAALKLLEDATVHLARAEEAAADAFEYSSVRSLFHSAQRDIRDLLKGLESK